MNKENKGDEEGKEKIDMDKINSPYRIIKFAGGSVENKNNKTERKNRIKT